MELSIIIQFSALCLTLVGIVFSYHKWRENVLHSRIDKLREEIDDRIENIENHYTRQEQFNQLADNLKQGLKSIQEEQHRQAQRFDEFFLKFIESGIKKNM